MTILSATKQELAELNRKAIESIKAAMEDDEGGVWVDRRTTPERRKESRGADRRQMSLHELIDIRKESGYGDGMTINQAHMYRLRKITEQAVSEMVEGK